MTARPQRSRFDNRFAAALAAVLGLLLSACDRSAIAPPIRVGVLHSKTGTMAISENAVLEATLLAIEQINSSGGLLNRRLEPVVADGQSDPEHFASEAERLLTKEHVSVVFGCWTSASRKAVKPVFEKHGALLFYPVQYEGLEQSPNIIYTGATPNQQVMPAVSYALEHFGKRVFLVGSDYVFPRTANAIIRDQIRALGGEVVDERYLPLGGTRVDPIVRRIAETKPDVILNTINGDSNIAFFTALRKAGIQSTDIPTVSFSIGETELRQIDPSLTVGDYAAWNYFQSVDTAENADFMAAFRKRYGADRVTSDPLEAAWFGVHLWAQAVRVAGSAEPDAVRKVIGGEGMLAPEGFVYIDGTNQHTWKYARVGRVRSDGQFDVVWSSSKPVRPIPFPIFRTRSEWEALLESLHQSWGGRWVNPDAETP